MKINSTIKLHLIWKR